MHMEGMASSIFFCYRTLDGNVHDWCLVSRLEYIFLALFYVLYKKIFLNEVEYKYWLLKFLAGNGVMDVYLLFRTSTGWK